MKYEDGNFLVVTHLEPDRLIRYDADIRQPDRTASTQAFRVENDRLIEVNPIDVPGATPAASFEVKGYGDYLLLTLALDENDSTWAASATGAQAHPYFGENDYFSIHLRAINGTEIAGGTVKGTQSAESLASALDGQPYAEGQYLVVMHQEPDRLLRFDHGALQPDVSARTQAFLVESGRLIPVAIADLPFRL